MRLVTRVLRRVWGCGISIRISAHFRLCISQHPRMLHSLTVMKRSLVEYFKSNHLSLTHGIVLLVCDLVQARDSLFGLIYQ